MPSDSCNFYACTVRLCDSNLDISNLDISNLNISNLAISKFGISNLDISNLRSFATTVEWPFSASVSNNYAGCSFPGRVQGSGARELDHASLVTSSSPRQTGGGERRPGHETKAMHTSYCRIIRGAPDPLRYKPRQRSR